LRAIRSNWPKTEILLRADSHYCTPETIDFCRANGLDFIFGVAPTSTLRAHILALEAKATAMFEAAPKNGKVRRFKEFFDGAQSWSRVERIVARVEAGADGPDTRFVVTNLTSRNARRLYEDVYCRRGQAENHIKSWKTHLAADRTSCMKASANQLRLFLHAGAYWLMWGLRQSMPRRSMWRVAQFDTLRLRLIKIAARVVEMKTMIRIHLPTSCCGQDISHRARKNPASRHLSGGARPENQTCPVNSQTPRFELWPCRRCRKCASAPPTAYPGANINAAASLRSVNYMVNHICEPIQSRRLHLPHQIECCKMGTAHRLRCNQPASAWHRTARTISLSPRPWSASPGTARSCGHPEQGPPTPVPGTA
jgi:Transposase DDE domain group 1